MERFVVFFLHEFVVIFAGVKNINISWPFPRIVYLSRCEACGPDPRWLSLTSWWLWSLCLVGAGPFPSEFANFPFSLPKWKLCVLSPWPSFLRWEIVLQLCCIIVDLLWKSPVSFL